MLKRLRQYGGGTMLGLAGHLYRHYVKHTGYIGNYSDWDHAQRDSTGYDSSVILARVRDALIRVKNGTAAYERDSVLFDEIQYSWPLLTGLLWIASCTGNCLNLLDFGGSLGSSYFQNRALLMHLAECRWSVVEQDTFVRCGREEFEDQNLKFYFTLEECYSARQPDTILLSSVLPYLKAPHELLSRIMSMGFTYVIIDRTPVMEGKEDRLTVQHVPPEIYTARYPAWILGRDRLLAAFSEQYELILQFDALAGPIFLGSTFAYDKGYIFRRRR